MEKSIKKKLSKKKYNWLVTGSSGFIGTNIVKKLLELKQNVIGIDIKNSKVNNNSLHFIKGNILNNKTLKKIPKNVDFVLHQASLTSVQDSIKKPKLYYNQNVKAFVKLLKFLKKFKIKKLIYASSCAVYGEVNKTNYEKDILNKNKMNSPYSKSKKNIEEYSSKIKTTFPKIGLRYFNVYGPHQKTNGFNLPVISSWMKQILNDNRIVIYGNGDSYRNYIYVDDVVNANISSAFYLKKDRILNICSKEKITLKKLNTVLMQVIKLLKIKYNKLPLYRQLRSGDIKSSHGSNYLARKKIKFKESQNLSKCLIKTFRWQIRYNKKSFI